MRRAAVPLIAALLLMPGPGVCAPLSLSLSRNADLLVPGRGSDRLHPPRRTEPAPAQARTVRIPVTSGGREIGLVRMTEDLKVAAEDLRPWVAANMNAETALAFESAGAITAGAENPYGLGLDYDAQNAVLVLAPEAARLKRRPLSFSGGGDAPGEEALAPGPLSGFVNVRAAESFDADNGRAGLRVDLDGAVNRRGWVLEGTGDVAEDDPHPVRRGDVRVVHDLPDRMVRLAAGDLSYPVTGFQSYARIAGVSVARNFELQPYRVTAPAGETAFTVRSPSTADVYVNGIKVRTLRLDPGPYDASDFPVSDGANDLKLVITDAAGRVEERAVSVFTDQSLLKEGLHAYAYNAGIRARDEGRRIVYDAGGGAFSAFHRYGFSQNLTAGAGAQGDRNAQQAGVFAVMAFGPGTLGVELSGSRLKGHGFAAAQGISLRLNDRDGRRDVSFSARCRGASFAALGMTAPVNAPKCDTAARFSQSLPRAAAFSVSGQKRYMRGGADDWAAGASVSKSFSPGLSLSLGGEARRDGGGVMLNALWSPQASRHSYAATLDTRTRVRDFSWRWRQDRAVDAWQADAGIAQSPGRTQGTGGFSYTGYRGEARARHDVTTAAAGQGPLRRTALFAATAIAFAGDRVAFSRPVGSGFVMVSGDRTLARALKSRPLGVNPESGTSGEGARRETWQARIDSLGPAVLPDAAAYMRRPVRIDTRGLPRGFDIGRDSFTALPSYKSGVLIEIGGAAQVTADGRLFFRDGTPAALAGGMVSGEEFFTNAAGRFRIARLKPGRHVLRLHDRPALAAAVDIPEGAPPGTFAAGDLVLQEGMTE